MGSADVEEDLRRLADHFAERTSWLVDIQLPSLRDFPSYAGVEQADLRRSGHRNALRLVATLRGEREELPGGTELEQATGRARAAQGIPVDEVVGLLRAVYATLGEVVVRTATELSLSVEATLEGMQRLWRTADRSTSDLLTGYHAEELRAATHRESARAAFVASVLHGAVSDQGDGAALQYGVSSTTRYHVVRTELPAGESEAREVRRRLERACRHADFVPLLVAMDGDLVGITAVVPRDWEGDSPVVVADPALPADLPAEVGRTAQGLAAAKAFALDGVVATSSLSVRGAVLERRDIGGALHQRYLQPLLEVRTGAELLETLAMYVRCGRSVARTADALIVHVNTVRYRLERVVGLTGVDVEDIDQLVELWWALAHHRVVEHERREGGRSEVERRAGQASGSGLRTDREGGR